MEQEFSQLCMQDVERFARTSSRSQEQIEEFARMRAKFLRGMGYLIAVVSENLPYVRRKRTTLVSAPAGQLPDSVRPEAARMAMRGESTRDIPRVAVESVETNEEIKGVPELRLHVFVPSSPSILSEANKIEEILQFLKTTLSVSQEELEQVGNLAIEELEIIPNLLKSGSRGLELITLDKSQALTDYLEKSWGVVQKSPGIKKIDLDLELREYLSKETGQQSQRLDLMVVSGFGPIESFCFPYRPGQRFSTTGRRGEEPLAAVFFRIFGSNCPYIYFSSLQAADLTEKEGYGVIGKDGTVYTVETTRKDRGE